jgi:nucleoside-diphosphate-sugar epimerase
LSYFLVTGCAWFIGARVCQLLLEPEPEAVEEVCRANHHIWGLDPSVLRFFTHPDHTAAGVVAAFRPVRCAAPNPGSDRPVALLRLVRLIEERVGRASSPGPEFRVGQLAREAA